MSHHPSHNKTHHQVFLLPDLGEGLKNAEIVQWHIQAGDTVNADDIIVSVETAKAIVDVPAEKACIIDSLDANLGESVDTGGALFHYTTISESKSPDTEAQNPRDDAISSARKNPTPITSDPSSTVVGVLPQAPQKNARKESANTGLCGRKISNEDFYIGAAQHPDSEKSDTEKFSISPALRSLANELNIDLHRIGTHGPQKSICPKDLAQAIRQQLSPQEPVNKKKHHSNAPVIDTQTTGHELTLSANKKQMCAAMELSRDTIAQATVQDQADISHWQNQDASWRLVRALIRACQNIPLLNSHFDGQQLKCFDTIELGYAVGTTDKLLVPVLNRAEELNESNFRQALDGLKTAITEQTIKPQQLRGASITLSNLGASALPVAGRFATPIIVPPQVAIVAAGKSFQALKVNEALIETETENINSRIDIGRFLPLSLSFDHRCLTGLEASQFLAAMILDLQAP